MLQKQARKAFFLLFIKNLKMWHSCKKAWLTRAMFFYLLRTPACTADRHHSIDPLFHTACVIYLSKLQYNNMRKESAVCYVTALRAFT